MFESLSFLDLDRLNGAGADGEGENQEGNNEDNEDNNEDDKSEVRKAIRNARRRQTRRLNCMQEQLQILEEVTQSIRGPAAGNAFILCFTSGLNGYKDDVCVFQHICRSSLLLDQPTTQPTN
jgi:hypothetical protein